MSKKIEVLKHIYSGFNARDIEGVLAMLAEDVTWANGMDGGHVQGQAALRAYWTRQWAMVIPHVEPLNFHTAEDGSIVADVQQTVYALDGKPLEDQTHGLRSKPVGHVFHFRDGKVTRFDIQDH